MKKRNKKLTTDMGRAGIEGEATPRARGHSLTPKHFTRPVEFKLSTGRKRDRLHGHHASNETEPDLGAEPTDSAGAAGAGSGAGPSDKWAAGDEQDARDTHDLPLSRPLRTSSVVAADALHLLGLFGGASVEEGIVVGPAPQGTRLQKD